MRKCPKQETGLHDNLRPRIDCPWDLRSLLGDLRHLLDLKSPLLVEGACPVSPVAQESRIDFHKYVKSLPGDLRHLLDFRSPLIRKRHSPGQESRIDCPVISSFAKGFQALAGPEILSISRRHLSRQPSSTYTFWAGRPAAPIQKSSYIVWEAYGPRLWW